MVNNTSQATNDMDIAIIGMTGRFPGAKNIHEFWGNLERGVSSIKMYSDEELRDMGVEEDLSNPRFVKAGALLDRIEEFDASFFGYSPREAEIIDPQQRVLLEGAWEVLENAGYDPDTYKGLIGVYVGSGLNTYIFELVNDPVVLKTADSLQIALSNDKDYVATRISYKLNLKGPSISVQTACSTSMVSIHTACQSLLSYDTDMAIAGGVSIRTPQKGGYIHKEGSILSSDGKCRAFDEKANGTVYGSGMGLVLLKRYKDARNDNDNILAIIKGSAVNNDGALKVGFTAPSIEGQAKVIEDALLVSDVSKDSISFIEAHGTGTKLGDPIEIEALNEVYGAACQPTSPIYIGSVKTNIGHLDAAAGVAGVIKTVLALRNKKIPAMLNYVAPNPKIPFDQSPFKVNNKLIDWIPKNGIRRAGVSSFGMGGTNAHLILEEAPVVESDLSKRPFQLLLLSAKTDKALKDNIYSLEMHLKSNPGLNFADAAYTLAVGRRSFEKKLFVVARDSIDATKQLNSCFMENGTTGVHTVNNSIVFMFSGQGSQYPNMGKELYETDTLFRNTVDYCCEYIKPILGLDIRETMYPDATNRDNAEQLLNQTYITQPALFIIEYALSKMWESWGIKPDAMIGHSIGEFTAACLAGVISLEDTLRLIIVRSALMQQTQPGKMLAVQISETELTNLMSGRDLAIAASNGPDQFVVSGALEAIDLFQSDLAVIGIPTFILSTSHAYHSSLMDEIAGEFFELMKRVNLKKPTIPYISNVTGDWITAEQATDPNYYVTHLKGKVNFWNGIQTLNQLEGVGFLEVGPGEALSKIVKRAGSLAWSTLPARSVRNSDFQTLLNTVGQLWLHGSLINWAGFYQTEKRYKVNLPTYCFQRERHGVKQVSSLGMKPSKDNEGKKDDIKEWFFLPGWKRSLPLRKKLHTYNKNIVIFAEMNLSEPIIEQLIQEGHSVVVVRTGNRFGKLDQNNFIIDPKENSHYRDLFKALYSNDFIPDSILHMWSLSLEELPWHEEMDIGLNSILSIVQGLERIIPEHSLAITMITEGLFDVTGMERLKPAKALVMGPVKVIHQEFRNLKCRLIDVETHRVLDSLGTASLTKNLVAELLGDSTDHIVSYRGSCRWVQRFDKELMEPKSENMPLRKNGNYLITGGLGGLGRLFAQYLVDSVQANLVLVGRTDLPSRDRWGAIIAPGYPDQETAEKIRFILSLEEKGSRVLVKASDVTDKDALLELVREAEEIMGSHLNGVIHMAGIPGSGLMLLKNPDTVRDVLAPKVQGIMNLSEVIELEKLDFFIAFSSILAVTGGLGQIDYVAANAFLGAFCNRLARKGLPVMSIDWDAWQIDSWQSNALGATIPEIQGQVKELRDKYGISATEGLQAFEHLLCNLMPQVVVSTKDLDKTIYKHAFYSDIALELEKKSSRNQKFKQKDFVSPGNETERIIVELWQDALGIEQVGVNDNFFDMGGHSLLAIKLISRLREVFEIDLPMQTIFDFPTVKQMSDTILELILEEIENMSEAEVEAMLEEKEPMG